MRSSVGRLRGNQRSQHGGDDPLIAILEHRHQRGPPCAPGSVASASACATRTVQSRSGSSRTASSEMSPGSIAASARIAAARMAGARVGHQVDDEIERCRGCAWPPARRPPRGGASDPPRPRSGSFRDRHATAVSRIAASARTASITIAGSRCRLVDDVAQAAAAFGAFSAPRPRAAKAAVNRPGVGSSASSAGTARASPERPSAYATGHHVDTGCPVRVEDARREPSYDPSRTSAYSPRRVASTGGASGHARSSAATLVSAPAWISALHHRGDRRRVCLVADRAERFGSAALDELDRCPSAP